MISNPISDFGLNICPEVDWCYDISFSP